MRQGGRGWDGVEGKGTVAGGGGGLDKKICGIARHRFDKGVARSSLGVDVFPRMARGLSPLLVFTGNAMA